MAETQLLSQQNVPAHFVALNGDRLNINLTTGPEWTRCIKAVLQSKNIFPGLTDVSEVVTDQFLCSGLEKEEDNPCKGESGGAVFRERKYRFFQVRSWIWSGVPARAQVLLAGGRWEAFEGNQRGRGLEWGLHYLHPVVSSLQVGLVSWGLFDPCHGSSNKNSRKKPPPGVLPRDFHINLFRLQPWLRQHLDGVLNFLPLGH